MDTLANSEDPNAMMYSIRVFTVCLEKTQSSGTEIHHPLKYKIDNRKLLVSICIVKSIRVKRVKADNLEPMTDLICISIKTY